MMVSNFTFSNRGLFQFTLISEAVSSFVPENVLSTLQTSSFDLNDYFYCTATGTKTVQ
jgi:hypothetical protein